MIFPRFFRLAVTGVIFGAVIWFYDWTVGAPRFFAGPQPDYYNLLVDGFQHGSLAMSVTPDPWLGVDNTKARHYLLDASFYQGKYYLYFGVTPAVVLFWPWTLVTGHDLPEPVAALLLAAAAFALSVGWLRTLQQRFFPQAGGWFWPMAILLLGVGTGYPVVLRRPLFYEIAILSGVVCSMGGLWCLTLAILRSGQSVRWLGLASLGAGLAAGSRPTLIPGAVLAVGLVAAHLWWRDRGIRGAAGGWRIILAAGLPLGVCGAGLAWYNWARFGNPLEFGLHYQLGSNGNGFPFRPGSLWPNLQLYYFTAPDFSWFFPFFSPGATPPGTYPEQVHGQFFWLPLFALAIWAGVAVAWRRQGGREFGAVLAAVLVWAGVALVFVGMAPVHSNRYQLDFHPGLVVATLLGLMFCLQSAPRRWVGRAALAWGGVVVMFNLGASFHVHGFFRGTHPEQFAALARVADRLVWPLHQWAGPRLGGVEVVVKFPAGTPGSYEPLLVAGGGPDMDALLIRYTAPGRGRIVFMHPGLGEAEGEDFDLQEGRARWLKIHLGTLYPPAWHPWYDSLPSDMARATNRVSVQVDGVEVLHRDVVCFQASANQVTLGRRAGFPIGRERFSGEIARVRGLKADQAWLEEAKKRHGPLRLSLLLPRDRLGVQEPLVMTGERGRTELVSITYVREGVIRFSVLHEGWGAAVSSPDIEWDYEQPLELRVNLGSLPANEPAGAAPADGVSLDLFGRIVLAHEYQTHPARPTQVYVGCTPWPLAGSRLMFGGQILPETPEDREEGPLRRAKQALLTGRPVEMQLVFPGKTVNQPIFTTGSTGAGDGLFVEYLSATEIRFGFDHWGSQPLFSPPVPAESDKPHRLTVSLGVRLSERATVPGRLQVRLDGRPLFDVPVDLFPADSRRVFFGANPIGMSTSFPKFSGEMGFPDGAHPAARPVPPTSP
jgi:hypothetical protein